MKTYAESIGAIPFNWLEFLHKETYTDQEFFSAVLMAELWPTCACGNQCASLPRTSAGAPMDDRLSELGVHFHQYLKHAEYYKTLGMDRWTDSKFHESILQARRVFLAIEFRSAQLLAEMEWYSDPLRDWPVEAPVPAEKELALT